MNESKRQVGKKLELYVAERLREILKDPQIRPTRNSGASNDIGDISNKNFYFELKRWTKKDIHFSLEVWNKLCSEIPMGQVKKPVYIFEHLESGKKFVMMELEDWLKLLEDKQ
jgi:hypothetical protein